MSVTHDFECMAHGAFSARGGSAHIPRCPRGCSAAFVKLVFLQAVGVSSARSKKVDALMKSSGLSDISTSPSRSGDSVMQRIRLKDGSYQAIKDTQMPRWDANPQKIMAAMNNTENNLRRVGLGFQHNPTEWVTTEDGKQRHQGATFVKDFKPPAEVERIKE